MEGSRIWISHMKLPVKHRSRGHERIQENSHGTVSTRRISPDRSSCSAENTQRIAQKHGHQNWMKSIRKLSNGLKPTSTVFLTQKEYLRNAIDECASTSNSFDEFQSKLLEQFQISVIDHRGRYSYLHPDRQKRITERASGTRYGKNTWNRPSYARIH